MRDNLGWPDHAINDERSRTRELLSTRAAVLLLAFNRPDTTRRVFDAIRQARPPRLYVSADGPRAGRDGEQEHCREVRRIATAVDWPCHVQTLFRERNVGCKLACSGGLSWFFEHEEAGIVLEDDVLPHETLFPFCEELLERYADDPRVWAISGNNFRRGHRPDGASYAFTRYPYAQGWASWRRAWRQNDLTMAQWPALRASDWLLRIGNGHRDFEAYWRRIFDAVAAGELESMWDYQWLFSIWSHDGLGILPSRNLVSNIGFGAGATHTVDAADWQGQLRTEPMPFPLHHPPAVEADAREDRWNDLNVYATRPPFHKALRRTIGSLVRRMLG